MYVYFSKCYNFSTIYISIERKVCLNLFIIFEEGAYCFIIGLSVGRPNGFRSLSWKLLITEFIFHVLIGFGEDTSIYLEFTKSKVKVTRVTCKNGFHSLYWELFITEFSYFSCLLVLVRTWPLLTLDSLGQWWRSQGSFCKNNM